MKAEEHCWTITYRLRGGHVAGGQVPVSRSLDFTWTPLYIHTKSTACIHICDLRKVRLVPAPSGTSTGIVYVGESLCVPCRDISLGSRAVWFRRREVQLNCLKTAFNP